MHRFFLALIVAAVALAAAPPVAADIVRAPAKGSVAEAMDRLEAAVTAAGATVFARVDHGAGAVKVGMALPPAELLIFGNAALGTPAMQADPLAGLYLPLKILIYEDAAGQVWVAYEPPADTFAGLAIDPGAAVIAKMTGALAKLSGAAAGG